MNTTPRPLPSSTFAPGTKIAGNYMGGNFTGVILHVESNESGYAADRNSKRIVWRTVADIRYGHELGCKREAGEQLIIHVESDGRGNYTRADDRYTNLRIVR